MRQRANLPPLKGEGRMAESDPGRGHLARASRGHSPPPEQLRWVADAQHRRPLHWRRPSAAYASPFQGEKEDMADRPQSGRPVRRRGVHRLRHRDKRREVRARFCPGNPWPQFVDDPLRLCEGTRHGIPSFAPIVEPAMSAADLPARGAMEFDVVIVGAGPAALPVTVKTKMSRTRFCWVVVGIGVKVRVRILHMTRSYSR